MFPNLLFSPIFSHLQTNVAAAFLSLSLFSVRRRMQCLPLHCSMCDVRCKHSICSRIHFHVTDESNSGHLASGHLSIVSLLQSNLCGLSHHPSGICMGVNDTTKLHLRDNASAHRPHVTARQVCEYLLSLSPSLESRTHTIPVKVRKDAR